MSAGWPPVLQRQVQVLVDQFLAGTGAAWIGIAGIGRLGVAGPASGTMRIGGRIEALGAHPMTEAFVWVQGSEPELWLDPRSTKYRDLFDEFARTRLGLAGRPRGADWNIDHVFPKAAGALDGMTHVRALAIGAGGNQALGRTVEKAMKGRADDAPDRKVIRHATWMTIGKAAGYEGWESLPDSASAAGNAPGVRNLFAFLATRGITAPAGALEESLTSFTLTKIR
ncbi:hypothetical protein [Plastoroseomonas hellenica]|uniref:hypothetical protein n=1 Tax=Plastoroseomonas hellenica TaxID=2687306 RepID=UPI001BA7C804|nr:hypothetical protein [Plastoroseomonas hellenica]MBR0646299.1 hypothetical protein [Plastoroseomonas hellenica]